MAEGKASMERVLAQMTDREIKSAVANRYGKVATDPDGKFNFPVGRRFAESVGYLPELLDKIPSSLWESFTGAGNPQPHVDITSGETVLDLGCGAGLDLYLYTQATGAFGRIYGLDMSEEMIAKAKYNMEMLHVKNVEFLLASADNVPLPDNCVDIVTANGIYNLSPDKEKIMGEVVRVLRPGGRTVFAEIVLKAPLPEEIRKNIHDWFRCIGGALPLNVFLKALKDAGLADAKVLWIGRNARTGHELSLCAVIRAKKD